MQYLLRGVLQDTSRLNQGEYIRDLYGPGIAKMRFFYHLFRPRGLSGLVCFHTYYYYCTYLLVWLQLS